MACVSLRLVSDFTIEVRSRAATFTFGQNVTFHDAKRQRTPGAWYFLFSFFISFLLQPSLPRVLCYKLRNSSKLIARVRPRSIGRNLEDVLLKPTKTNRRIDIGFVVVSSEWTGNHPQPGCLLSVIVLGVFLSSRRPFS
ncbi:hypothetical protein KC368_g15 [Hortaea werneckii]|nr:hypothetical protein KC368_g15 [Hortaea werneckii]